ncbi:MAG: hypothetical protein FWF60_02245 [Oscillospiraceae bacterium]|nr:hypothetical protein [Oscillospiraceae bacterium]MCL1951627.1 hypothetical protein [Oscillospiraceae bacterium]
MKKLLSLALAAVLLLGLCACGRTSEPAPTTSPPIAETGVVPATLPQPNQKPKQKVYYSADGTLHFTMTYEYDERGNEIRREQHFADGGAYTYTLQNTYNEKGQLVQADIQINGGDSGYITYEYYADGQLIRSVYIDTGFGEFNGHTTYTYNKQGQLIQTEWVNDNPSRSTFEYDAQGLISRENLDNGCYYIYEY